MRLVKQQQTAAFSVCCASLLGYRGGDVFGEQKSEEQDVRDFQSAVHC